PTAPRAPFGASQVERQRASVPPRFEAQRAEPRAEPARPDAGREVGRPHEGAPRALPGEPANRVSPWRREGGERHGALPAPAARAAAPVPAAAHAPAAVDRGGDARRTPPKPAADHAEGDERPARGRADRSKWGAQKGPPKPPKRSARPGRAGSRPAP